MRPPRWNDPGRIGQPEVLQAGRGRDVGRGVVEPGAVPSTAEGGSEGNVGSGEAWWGSRDGDRYDEPLVDYIGPPPEGKWTQDLVDEMILEASEAEEGSTLARFLVGCAVRYIREVMGGPRRCVAWTHHFGIRKPCSRPPLKQGPLAGLLCSSHKAHGSFIMNVAFTDFVVRTEFAFDEEMRLD
eukprot:gene4219-4521_t